MNRDLVALNAALAGLRADIWTALPCIVDSYDPATQTASVQPAVQAQSQDKEGTWSNVNLPLLVDVPVWFPGAGGFALTMPVKQGDEGLVVFSSRCIDAFWQSGGVQPQAESRMHDLSDAIFLPGRLSQPKKLADVSADNPQLRNEAGTVFLEMVEGGFRLKGNVAVDGAITATGEITRGKDTVDEVTLGAHRHAGVAVGGASTLPPTAGT